MRVFRQVGLKQTSEHEFSVTIVRRAPLRGLSNRQRAESLTELPYRLAFDKQQNGLRGHLGLSHLFVNCVNRLCMSQTGNGFNVFSFSV
jgi:hypothetical protein